MVRKSGGWLGGRGEWLGGIAAVAVEASNLASSLASSLVELYKAARIAARQLS